MQHIMIDLETFGITPKCPVITVGAVYFDPTNGKQGAKFYETIEFENAFKDRDADPSTIKWWLTQSDAAREALYNGTNPEEQETVLGMLNDFVKFDDTKKFVWGNGATFDISILEDMYRQHKMNIPWPFHTVRDVRTICHLAEGLVDRDNFIFEGEKHTALADAQHQAKYVSAMWQALRGESYG